MLYILFILCCVEQLQAKKAKISYGGDENRPIGVRIDKNLNEHSSVYVKANTDFNKNNQVETGVNLKNPFGEGSSGHIGAKTDLHGNIQVEASANIKGPIGSDVHIGGKRDQKGRYEVGIDIEKEFWIQTMLILTSDILIEIYYYTTWNL